jgi:hypothetical protein
MFDWDMRCRSACVFTYDYKCLNYAGDLYYIINYIANESGKAGCLKSLIYQNLVVPIISSVRI